jgi:hypothetical protein
LKWQLKLGDSLPRLEKLQAMGKKVPMLDSKPELTFQSSYYMRIFQDLNSCRPRANGAEPISAQEIYFYCELHGIAGVSDRSDIFDMVKHLDNSFMTFND